MRQSDRVFAAHGRRLVADTAPNARRMAGYTTRLAVAVLGVFLAGGCSWPPASQTATPQAAGRDIVVEFRTREMKADATKDSMAKHIAPAVVGTVGLLSGGNPLFTVIAYAAGYVGLAAVEQGKSGSTVTVVVRVPKLPGESSCTIIKPDGSAIVLTGGATAATFPDDGLPDGLTPGDAALWRRLSGALGAMAEGP